MPDHDEELADRIATGLARARTTGAHPAPQLYRPLLRMLARGAPVTITELAAAAGRPEPEVAQAVVSWPDTEYDHDGRIIGYGLTQRPTAHRFTTGGHQLFTWCALDTLIFPAILEAPADVESPCHATGTPIRLHVDPISGVTALDPPAAVVSILSIVAPDEVSSVREAFCNQVHFYADTTAAHGWLADHPGMGVLPVADAHRLARPLADNLLDDGGSLAGYCAS